MMIISSKAIIDELERTRKTLENYPQRANLYILLANEFMNKAYNTLFDPEFLTDTDKQSEDQLKTYFKIYSDVKEISGELDELSKISTKYVQDLKS